MLDMYQKAKLIHSDLGGYNLLVHQDALCVIDLAQAVSTDHPSATHYLRRDCFNVTSFFTKVCRRLLPVFLTISVG